MDLKIESYIKDMERRGIKGYLIAPPVFRLLWCFGLKVRPPLFNSFASNFIIFGFFWSIVVGCIEYAYDLIFSVSPHEPQLALAIFTGVAMGLLMAQQMAKQAKNHALPDWNNYSSSEQEESKS